MHRSEVQPGMVLYYDGRWDWKRYRSCAGSKVKVIDTESGWRNPTRGGPVKSHRPGQNGVLVELIGTGDNGTQFAAMAYHLHGDYNEVVKMLDSSREEEKK